MSRSSNGETSRRAVRVSADVSVCDPGEDREWDLRWKETPGWTVFHSSAWAKVLRSTYGFSPCYLELTANNARRGLLPVMEPRSLLFGRRGVSLPFSDTCPMLCADPSDADTLLQGALTIARQRRWRYLELRGDSSPKTTEAASIRFFEHILDLPQDEGTLFSRFKPELRTAIRKAQKSGIVIEMGTGLNLVQEFYRLHSRTRQRQGMPPQPFKFFRNLQKCILEGQGGVVVIARKGQESAAGAVFLHTGKSAVFKFGASNPGFLSLRPNNLVMWSALQAYLQRGVTSIHMGRTSILNEGLRRFKLAWGTTELPLCYRRIDPITGTMLEATDRSSGVASQIFRYLPRPVLHVLGNLLYRHVD